MTFGYKTGGIFNQTHHAATRPTVAGIWFIRYMITTMDILPLTAGTTRKM